MKLRYIANVRLPTEKAHGVQIMSMCSAFALLGAEVELVTPTRASLIEKDPFEYYAVERNFTIRTLPIFLPWTFHIPFLSWLSYLVSRYLFAWRALQDARRDPADTYFFRDELTFRIFGDHGVPGVWEVHDVPNHMHWYTKAVAVSRFVVAISEGLKRELSAQGVPSEKILVEPDGAWIDRFQPSAAASIIRERFRLTKSDVLVAYVGRLMQWKGVPTLVEAARSFPPNIFLLIVGGEGEELRSIREKMEALKVRGEAIGQVPHYEVASYVQAADIFVIPNSAKDTISREYTSPLKVFEALAAGRPIVASDLPSLREILDETVASFAKPDDPSSLSKTILALADDASARAAMRAHAVQKAQRYDWSERARRILARIDEA